MHTKLLCYSKLLINKVLGRTQCGDEEDRCIFGESLFVPDQVAVSHLLPLSSSCQDNCQKVEEEGGGGGEDEGWLMDFVYFPSNHSSAWLLWDARHIFDIIVRHHFSYFFQ